MRIQYFFKGAQCFLTGTRRFYSDRSLWKYAALPFCLMLVIYLGFTAGAVCLAAWLAAKLEKYISTLPGWINWAAQGISTAAAVGAVIFALIAAILTFSAFYEIFSGPFFDHLLEKYEQKYHGQNPQKIPFFRSLRLMLDAAGYSINTLVFSLLLSPLALLLPVIGPLLLYLFASCRIGTAFVAPSGFLRNQTIKEQLKFAEGRKFSIFGFGLMINTLFLLPGAPLILLPGAVLGGCEVCHLIQESEQK